MRKKERYQQAGESFSGVTGQIFASGYDENRYPEDHDSDDGTDIEIILHRDAKEEPGAESVLVKRDIKCVG
jgi:hypothetical protein